MNNKIGVMQGRLLPKYQGRYQAHPVDYWEQEFFLAEKLELDCIEFILDFNDFERNPLIRDGGIDEIILVSKRSKVEVKSICLDYLMEAPIHSRNNSIAKSSQEVLRLLLNNVSRLGVSNVVIPCVDQSSLYDASEVRRFIQNLRPLISIAERFKINLSLETDLPPKPFLDLLESINSDRVTVNYDIGNSAALGYDVNEELEYYGNRITDIHIKDRILGGGPVELGKGNADFSLFFNKLKDFNYQGPFIMQAYRDEEGIDIFKKQYDWIRPYLDE